MSLSKGSFTALNDESVPVSSFKENAVLSIRGTFVGTISLQVSEDGGENWETEETYTASARKVINGTSSGWLYKLKATAWTSGEAFYGIG